MAVVYVREHWPNRAGGGSKIDDQNSTRYFRIETNSKTDDEHTIYASGLFPVRLSAHPNNSAFRATKLNAKQISADPFHWTGTVRYSTAPVTEAEEEKEEFPNPLDRPVVILPKTFKTEEAITQDRDGKPFMSSAGEPLSPQTRTLIRPGYTWKKNFAQIPSFVWTHEETVNELETTVTVSGDTLTYPAEQVKVTNILSSEKKTENDQDFYTVTGELIVDRDGWTLDLLDEGTWEIDQSDFTKRNRATLSGDKTPPRKTVLLDGAGSKLDNPSPDNAVYLVFKIEKTSNFSDLPCCT